MITRLKSVFIRSLFISGVCLATIASASLSEDMETHYTGKIKAVHVDNLFLNSAKTVGDRYLVFSPGFELSMAEKGAVSYSLGYTHHFTAYRDFSSLNDDFPDFNAKINYNSNVLIATGYVDYKEWASNTIDVNADGILVEWRRKNYGGKVHYALSDLTAFKVGIDFADMDYKMRSYTDYESVAIPVSLHYSIRPKIDLTTGLRYRNVDTFSALGSAFDYKDSFYYIGAVGELFSPKVYGDIKYGYQKRDYEDSPRDESSSSYDISVIYTADAKTSMYLAMAKDYKTSAIGGLAYSFTNLAVGAQYRLTKTINFSGEYVIGDTDYQDSDRGEDITMINLSTSYQPNDYLTLSARYEHSDVEGNNKGGASNYEKNEFSVSASVRY